MWDSDSQDGKLDNMDFHVEGYIYGKKVEETKIKLEKALEKRQGLLVMPDGRSAQVKIEEGWHITKSEEADDKYNLDFSFKKIDSDSLSLKIIELQELDDEKFTKATAEAEKSFLAEFDEKFTFEGFPGFVKLQSYDNLVSITNKISKLSANNLIGQITNPISGSLDILAASAGGIGAAILSYAKLRDLFGELTDKDYFDTYISMAGIKSDVKKPDVSAEASDQIYQNGKASEELINQEAIIEAVDEAVYHKEYKNAADLTETIETLIDTALSVAITLHSQLPLADAYSLDNIISSPVSGKSQGSGRQYHQTVDIANQSRLNAAISELEYDCYDLKVTGSSFRTTDDQLYRLNSALKIKDPWIELNDSFLITDVDLTSGPNGCRAALNLEKMA